MEKQHNGDINNRPYLSIALSIILFLVGATTSILILKDGFNSWCLIGFLFVALGILLFVYSLIRLKALNALNALLLDESAFVTDATFIKAKFSSYSIKKSSVNGIPFSANVKIFKKIVYEYKDQNGQIQTVKSTLSYTNNQVNYLKYLKNFKIKCNGKTSAIIEIIPEAESDVKF